MAIPTGVDLVGEGRYVVRTTCESWAYFVHAYALDLADGGVFVECLAPPVGGSTVELWIELPDDARDLVVEGEVVTVREPAEAFMQGVGPGFGMQLRISDENRDLLRRIIEQAQSTTAETSSPTGDASESSGSLRLFVPHEETALIAELEKELASIESADDRIRLGLPEEFDTEMIFLSFHIRSQHWKTKAQGKTSPEIPVLVERICDVMQQACARLSAQADIKAHPASPPPSKPPPKVVNVVAAAPTPPQRSAPAPAAEPPPQPASHEETRRRLSKLREQGLRAAPGARKAAPAPAEDVPDPMVEVRAKLRDRDYDGALATLRSALKDHASHPRAKSWEIWEVFIEARVAAAHREFHRAVELYAQVLELNPSHPLAQREIAIARCMIS
jgi:Tfp pilus assembly protein PilZ